MSINVFRQKSLQNMCLFSFNLIWNSPAYLENTRMCIQPDQKSYIFIGFVNGIRKQKESQMKNSFLNQLINLEADRLIK